MKKMIMPLLTLIVVGCAANGMALQMVPPGYDGPVPSGDAQSELKKLSGVKFRDSEGRFGGGEWTVGSGFSVTPHAGVGPMNLSTKEPHAMLIRAYAHSDRVSAEDCRYVRLDTDEQAAALVALVRKGLIEARAASLGGDEPLRRFNPLVSWIGEHSAVREKGMHRIDTREEWVALWTKHVDLPAQAASPGQKEANPEIPDVDFDQCMVVALFAGETEQSRGEAVSDVEEFKDRVRLRCYSMTYGIAIPEGQTFETYEAPIVTPFGIFVLPRIAKPLVVKRPEYPEKLKPPVWHIAGRLEVPSERKPPPTGP